ncbi:MAG TPA: twin-arginine translocation signal domain-containing protein, partial [Bryobacteraceae bacterium]
MKSDPIHPERRSFLKAGAAAVAAGFPAIISAQTVTNAIKVGLVGCGGRGSGAASQALSADDYAELVAMADIDQRQIDHSMNSIKRIAKIADRVKVEPAKQFVGLDGYQKVLASGIDVVLLATPPGFRPLHLGA